ncbi:GNAT family N-acetyltransferase [Streptomyces meridianus]|uniref:GNAT family N-acetyltransferase n=1 Tax=Streptomyces meridianus TaxID=2938945 RepID=A0ABT0X788_9ACTN|nr:GNAT family N-acetyltransferase [Streptomyces meridianus]MCM2578393.1 GNAT family N-acetyltransferase [Streptomyces meridianus]
MEELDLGEVSVRRASQADADALAAIDVPPDAVTAERRSGFRLWCGQGDVFMAETPSGPLGFCVLDYSFFEHGFITRLYVARDVRGKGIGTGLLAVTSGSCVTPKLFTSARLSNHAMQRLLQRVGWRPVGMLDGLNDEDGELELFYLCPPRHTPKKATEPRRRRPAGDAGLPERPRGLR